MTCTILPFTFGIALLPRASARNWPLVERLLDLTLTSACAQTDPAFQIIIVGHDRPRSRLLDCDPRISFLEVRWPVEPPGPHNDDSGRKKHLINDLVLARGGGLLMLLDADDWIDRGLVAAARESMEPDQVGGLLHHGFATDLQSLRVAPLPAPGVFAQPFYKLCGSSTIARLRPDDPNPLRRDPFGTLRSHHQWDELASERGVRLARLPVVGNYLINTSENHSEIHSPHVEWRKSFIGAVNSEGSPVDHAFCARFGLGLEQIRTASAQVVGPDHRAQDPGFGNTGHMWASLRPNASRSSG